MVFDFKEEAIKHVKQAAHEERAGNYAKAIRSYNRAVDILKTQLKYEKNPKTRELFEEKIPEYISRVEEIRAVMEEGRAANGSGGDVARWKSLSFVLLVILFFVVGYSFCW